MGGRLSRFVEVLFGESGAVEADADDLFDVTSGYTTLGTAGYDAAGRAGLCLSRADGVAFERVLDDVDALLALSTETPGTDYDVVDDDHGYRWLVVEDRAFDDLVTTVHTAADALIAEGYSEYLLCAAFAFEGERTVYWIYNFSRGTGYPFVPAGATMRDGDRESQLAALVEGEFDLEDDPSRRYPFWSIPV
jgi:hypothetical protein